VSLVTAEFPILALILQVAATPIHIGFNPAAKWTLFAGMTIRPAATSSRTNSGAILSRWAQIAISDVICPDRAASS
jgi:hypothetical protein